MPLQNHKRNNKMPENTMEEGPKYGGLLNFRATWRKILTAIVRPI